MAPSFASIQEGEGVVNVLPTLLTSRPRVEAELEGRRGRTLKPACRAIEVEEEEEEEEDFEQVRRLESDGHLGVCVRNTFLDTAEKRSPSLEDFYRERAVRTCPSASIGTLRGLFREGAGPETPSSTSSPMEVCRSATDGAELLHAAPGRGRTIVSLAESLEGPRPYPSGQDMMAAPPAAQHATVAPQIAQAMQPSLCASVAATSEAPYDMMTYGSQCSYSCPSTSAPMPVDYGAGQHIDQYIDQPASQYSYSFPSTSAGFGGQGSEYGFAGQALGHQQHTQCDYGGAPQAGDYGFQQRYLPGSGFQMSSQALAYEPYRQSAASPPPVFPMGFGSEGFGSEAAVAAGVSLGPVRAMPSPPIRPALGTEELPSVGSQAHGLGSCKPCAFLHTKGCENGLSCQFCHLCECGEKKRRRKAKLESQRMARREASTKK